MPIKIPERCRIVDTVERIFKRTGFRPNQFRSVSVIGPGSWGPEIDVLANNLGVPEIWCIDWDPAAIEGLQLLAQIDTWRKPPKIILGDATRVLPTLARTPDEGPDLVTALRLNSFEKQLTETNGLLAAVQKALKPGGVFIASGGITSSGIERVRDLGSNLGLNLEDVIPLPPSLDEPYPFFYPHHLLIFRKKK